MKRNILAVCLIVLSLVFAGIAHADIIQYAADPSILHIGNPPNGGTYLFNNEVNPIGNTSLGITMQGQPHTTLDSPLWLILAVPNSTSLTSAISGLTGLSGGSAGAPTYMTNLDPGEEVYGILNVGGGSNNSNSFTNFSAADLAINGINAKYFGIFVYNLYGTGINPNQVDVTFGSALPAGTFAIAYGQTHTTQTHHGVTVTTITPYTTPFTESGLTQVPEPGTFMLLGSGLLGFLFFGKRRLNK